MNAALDAAWNIGTELPLPKTCVMDLAFIKTRSWALLEFNASWGAGLNGCDPLAAARCIAAASACFHR